MHCDCFGFVFGSPSTVEASGYVPEVMLMLEVDFCGLWVLGLDFMNLGWNKLFSEFFCPEMSVFLHVRISDSFMETFAT